MGSVAKGRTKSQAEASRVPANAERGTPAVMEGAASRSQAESAAGPRLTSQGRPSWGVCVRCWTRALLGLGPHRQGEMAAVAMRGKVKRELCLFCVRAGRMSMSEWAGGRGDLGRREEAELSSCTRGTGGQARAGPPRLQISTEQSGGGGHRALGGARHGTPRKGRARLAAVAGERSLPQPVLAVHRPASPCAH